MNGATAPAIRIPANEAGADGMRILSTERDVRIDAARAIAIILVVLGHAKGIPQAFTILAYSFHVPLFFFLSGWFVERRRIAGMSDEATRLARTLLLPYLAFFALAYAYWLLTRNIGEKAARWGERPWWEPLRGLLDGIGPDLYVHPAIWFLVALFTTSLLYRALRRVLPLAWLAPLSLLAAWCWIAFFPALDLRLPWALDIAPVSLFFMAAGALAARARVLPATLPVNLLLAAMLAPVWVWIAMHNGRVDINQLRFGASPAMFFAAGLAGIALTLALSRLVQDWTPLQWLGRNTLLILCTHILVFFVLSGIVSLAGFGGARPGLGWALIVSLIALLSSVPLRWVFARWAPWAIGQRRLAA